MQWLDRGVNGQHLKVHTDRPALLMVLDNFYKDWHAHVDGKDTPILRANYAFRAIPVSAGDHDVELTYLVTPYHMPAMISALTLLLLMALVLWPVRRVPEPANAA